MGAHGVYLFGEAAFLTNGKAKTKDKKKTTESMSSKLWQNVQLFCPLSSYSGHIIQLLLTIVQYIKSFHGNIDQLDEVYEQSELKLTMNKLKLI